MMQRLLNCLNCPYSFSLPAGELFDDGSVAGLDRLICVLMRKPVAEDDCCDAHPERRRSMRFPAEEVEALRQQYPAGTRIRLIFTDAPYTKAAPGDLATVQRIDDAGQLVLRWDRGNTSISLIPGVDRFEKVEEEKT